MKINPNKCVACGNCTYICPMGAIYIDPVIKRATIVAPAAAEPAPAAAPAASNP